jgi:hypothetical protein
VPEPALPQQVCLREPARRRREVRVRHRAALDGGMLGWWRVGRDGGAAVPRRRGGGGTWCVRYV